eukprot:gene2011-2621_t
MKIPRLGRAGDSTSQFRPNSSTRCAGLKSWTRSRPAAEIGPWVQLLRLRADGSLSRVPLLTGLVRESVLAAQLGLGPLADAAALIVTIPDLFANLLAGGAISAVLIPELVRREPPEARRLFGQVAAGTVVGFAGLVVVLHLDAGTLVRLLAPGFSGDEVDRAATGVGLALWAIVPTVLAGVVTA